MSYIEFKNITKIFGENVSCDSISLTIEKSQVHGLIGENGAGKSTLMKLLGGLHSPSSGEMFLLGRPYRPRSAQDAFRHKIAFIHQHFVLATQLTALDNLVLSSTAAAFSLGSKKTSDIRRQAEALLKKFNWHIPLERVVNRLSVGEQQRLEILKALMQSPDIIIFDEPTAVLTPQESQELMNFIKQLRAESKTVILITHKLNEIKEVSDRISILRHGRHIATREAAELSVEQMAELMIGRKSVPHVHQSSGIKKPVLMKLPHTDIDVYSSEVFGVAGIEGNGQDLLIQNLLTEFRSRGLRYGDMTEDRIKLSVFENLNLTEHMLLKHSRAFSRGPLIDRRSAHSETTALVKTWDVRPPDARKKLSELSGGNQQKFVVARELWGDPEVVLAAHPTRGVDLGAQEKIHSSLSDFAHKNKTVFLISSDLDEVLSLSDRFVIINKNKFHGPFTRQQLSEQQIGLYMAGDL
jgi:simple sugar transport system ATP-binding protein